MKLSEISKKWKILAAVLAGLILLGGIPLGYMIAKRNDKKLPPADPIVFSGGAYTSAAADLPEAFKTLKVTADGTDSRIIPAAGKLILTTAGPTDVKTLTDCVKITPAVPMSVKQNSETEFEISPASGTFTPGNLYRLTVGDPENPAASYAFQVETELFVRSTLPADLALHVPTDTGVEFTFSDAVTTQDFSDYITVSPKVKGSFERYPDGRTVAFVPDKKLEYDTVYEFTVKPGIVSVAGKKLEEGKTVKFRTWSAEYEAQKDGSSAYLYLNTDAYRDNLCSPGENATVRVSFWGHKLKKEGTFVAKTYAFPSAKAAADAMLAHEKRLGDCGDNDVGYDLKSLKAVGEVSVKAGGGEQVLDLGVLDRGVYLVQITAEVGVENSLKTLKKTAYSFVQVTDIRPYTAASDGRLLVWTNAAQGGELAGVNLNVTAFARTDGWNVDESTVKTLTAVTANDGTAMLETGSATGAVVLLENGSDACVICAGLRAEEAETYYMSYIYTDREVYFSDDTVRFWGFIRNQYTGEIPEKMYLSPRNSARKQEITVYPDGSFSGEYKLEQMRQGSVYLALSDAEGCPLVTETVRVTEEQKPVYTAKLELDKPYYRRGETVTATLTASFFDGTPAEGLEFRLNANDYGGNLRENYTTDKNGQIRITFRTGQVKAYGTSPLTFGVSAELVNFETQYLWAQATGLYYHSDLIYTVSGWENPTEVAVSLHNRDFAKTVGLEGYYWDETAARGTPASGKISYTLYKYVITRTPVTNYNSYTKRTEHTWKYDRAESTVRTGTEDFRDGKLTLPKYEVQGFTGGYYYKIFFTDGTSGNTYENTVNAVKNSRTEGTGTDYIHYSLTLDREAYLLGDTFTARVTANDEPLRALFITAGDGFHKYAVGESFTDTFDKTLLPAATVYGIYYDAYTGRYGDQVQLNLAYDYAAAATLDVTVTPDKQSYKPGETAVVQVKVPGGANGKVLLSIVDEACFALGEQNVNVFSFFGRDGGYVSGLYLPGFYDTYDYAANSGNSHKAVALNARFSVTESSRGLMYRMDAAEMETGAKAEAPTSPGESNGTQGDTYVRRNFADNPEFQIVSLDAAGNGTLVFTVPDNITSWRITAIAAANLEAGIDKVKLGQSVSDTVCTQPFFINLTACDTYIVGDTLSLSARAYGPLADGKVTYTAVLTDEKGQKIAETSAKADSKDRAWLKFDAQPEGIYTVTVYGACGEGRDALETRMQVIASAVSADVRRTVRIDEIKTIQAKYYPVTLTFFNPTESGPLYDSIVSRLRRGNGSNRADMLAAKYMAIKASEALYGTSSTEDLAAIAEELRDYGSVLLTLLPYSEEDAELTAQICALCPELLDAKRRENIIAYFNRQLAETQQTDDVALCTAVAALAALGEPVLDRLYAIAAVGNQFSDKAKLYLALGFACAGDFSAANDIYGQIKEKTGTEDTEYGTLYLKSDNAQTSAELTALALCVTARTARDDAAKLAAYLKNNGTLTASSELALATYLRFFLPTGPLTEKTFAYTLGDVREEITLKSGRGYTVQLTKADLAEFDVTACDEGITVRAAYRGNPQEMFDDGYAMSDRVKIQKTVEPYMNNMYRVTLRISGTSTRVSESFVLNDTVPAGARLVRMETDAYANKRNGGIYLSANLWNRSGQNLTGSVHVYNSNDWNPKEWHDTCPEYSFDISVSYIIRGAVEGTYSAEPAFIRNDAAGIFSVSEGYRVEIRENGDWKIN